MTEPLTEETARAICARLASSHPDRAMCHWIPRQTEAGWEVVKIGLPPPVDNLGTELRADEQPMTGEDPRSSLSRNTGGTSIGG